MAGGFGDQVQIDMSLKGRAGKIEALPTLQWNGIFLEASM
jgi:hypothetical protein